MENFLLYCLVLSFTAPLVKLVTLWNRSLITNQVVVLLFYTTFFLGYNLFFDKIESTLGGDLYYFIYTVVEFSTFSFLILKSDDSIRFNRTVKSLWATFLSFCLLRIIFKGKERMDSYEIALEAFIILALIIYFFYLRFKTVDENFLYQNPYFWLMIGMLVYLSFTFFFFILVNHVDNEVIKNYYPLSYIGDILKNILFAVALSYMPRRTEVADRSRSFNAPNLDLI